MSIMDLNFEEDPDKKVCKGQIYRCHIYTFINAKGHVIFKTEYVPMKRLSCPVCESCDWVPYEIKNFIDNGTPITHEPKEGQLYRVAIINEKRDYETGYIDEWDIAFLPVGENK